MRWFVLTLFAAGLVVAAAGTAAADHLKNAPGTWKMVSAERDGKPLPKEQFDNDITLTIKPHGDDLHIIVKKGDKVVSESMAKLAKTGEKHDQYDITYIQGRDKDGELKGKTFRGIISVEGDTMKVCWHGAEGYPKDFSGGKGSGCTLRTLKRIKE